MITTKVAPPGRAPEEVSDVATGSMREGNPDVRIFGSSRRSDYIFSVR